MKLNYLFLTFLLLTSSELFAQKITYSGKNVPLKTVFAVIQKQTGYGFFYDPTLLSRAKSVSIAVKNSSLTDVLGIVFKHQPLQYSIENKTILVAKKDAPKKDIVKEKSSTKALLPDSTAIAGQLQTKSNSEPGKKDSTAIKPASDQAAGPGTKPTVNSPVNTTTPGNIKSGQSFPNGFSSQTNFQKPFLQRVFGSLETERMTLGFKGGMNVSNIFWKELSGIENDYRSTDFYAGLFADKRMTSTFNLGTELLFSLSANHHHIELPLHVKYKAGDRWNILGGPKLDLLIDRYYNKPFSLSGEVGTQYAINQIFFAEARFAYGFTSHSEPYSGNAFRRNTFRVGIGANFTRNDAIENTSAEPEPLRLRFGLTSGSAINSDYGLLAGGDFRIQENFGRSIAGSLSAGYSHFWWKSGGYLSYFPIKAGLKFYPTGRFYLFPEAGFAFGLGQEQISRPFILAAGIGTEIKKGFDISLRYEKMHGNLARWYVGMPDIPRPEFIALRAEYGFNLRPVGNKSNQFRETKEPPAWTGTHKKSVFLELGGHGLEVSANFDMRLKPNRNDGPGFSAGAGITYESLSIPLVFNYILGRKRSGIEAGIGVTGLISKSPYENHFWYNESGERFSAVGMLSLGYRLQSYNGLMLKTNFSAVYDGLYFKKLFNRDGGFYPYFPGLSIGYAFR